MIIHIYIYKLVVYIVWINFFWSHCYVYHCDPMRRQTSTLVATFLRCARYYVWWMPQLHQISSTGRSWFGNCRCHQTECKWRNSVHFRVQCVSPLFWLHDFALGFWSDSRRSEDDLESHWIGISWSGYYAVKLRKLSDISAQLFVTLLCGDEHCAGLLCSETSHWKDLHPWWIHWVVQSSSESPSPSAYLPEGDGRLFEDCSSNEQLHVSAAVWLNSMLDHYGTLVDHPSHFSW